MISSVVAFANMAIANPALLTVSPLSPLTAGVDRYRTALNNPSGCNCKKNEVLRDYKGMFESAMSALSDLDQQQLKNILKVDQVCYYTLNANKALEMKCF